MMLLFKVLVIGGSGGDIDTADQIKLPEAKAALVKYTGCSAQCASAVLIKAVKFGQHVEYTKDRLIVVDGVKVDGSDHTV